MLIFESLPLGSSERSADLTANRGNADAQKRKILPKLLNSGHELVWRWRCSLRHRATRANLRTPMGNLPDDPHAWELGIIIQLQHCLCMTSSKSAGVRVFHQSTGEKYRIIRGNVGHRQCSPAMRQRQKLLWNSFRSTEYSGRNIVTSLGEKKSSSIRERHAFRLVRCWCSLAETR